MVYIHLKIVWHDEYDSVGDSERKTEEEMRRRHQ